jgi:hypothetical protein
MCCGTKTNNCLRVSSPCSLVVKSLLVDELIALVTQSVVAWHPALEADEHLQAMGLGHLGWTWEKVFGCLLDRVDDLLVFQGVVRLSMRLASQCQCTAVRVNGKKFEDVGHNLSGHFRKRILWLLLSAFVENLRVFCQLTAHFSIEMILTPGGNFTTWYLNVCFPFRRSTTFLCFSTAFNKFLSDLKCFPRAASASARLLKVSQLFDDNKRSTYSTTLTGSRAGADMVHQY